MLIGSHSRLHYWDRTTKRGSALVVGYVRTNWGQSGRIYNVYSDIDDTSAVPVGYLHPNALVMPMKPGGMGVTFRGAGDVNDLNLAGGVAAEATLTGSGDITSAIGQLIVSAAATLTGSGSLSADAVAFLNAAATLAGSGSLTAAIDAIGHAAAELDGAGSMTSTIRATGTLEAEITPFTDLSPQSLAAAVWSSEQGRFLYALSRNKVVTDPAAGTYTVYDEDGVTVLYTADLWADAAGTTPYSGSGAERRDRLT